MEAALYLNGRKLTRTDYQGLGLEMMSHLFSQWDLQLLKASAWSAEQWEQFLTGSISRHHHLFILSTQGLANILGVMACYAFPGESWLHLQKIIISPGFQGQGRGGTLIEQLRQHFPGVTIQLEVSLENTRAISFYEAQGFSRMRISPGFYSDGRSALMMSG